MLPQAVLAGDYWKRDKTVWLSCVPHDTDVARRCRIPDNRTLGMGKACRIELSLVAKNIVVCSNNETFGEEVIVCE